MLKVQTIKSKPPVEIYCRCMPTLCITFYNIRRAYEFGFGRPGFQVKCLGKMCGHEVAVVVAGREVLCGAQKKVQFCVVTGKCSGKGAGNLWWSCSVSAVWADDKYPYLFRALSHHHMKTAHFPGHHIHPYPTSHH